MCATTLDDFLKESRQKAAQLRRESFASLTLSRIALPISSVLPASSNSTIDTNSGQFIAPVNSAPNIQSNCDVMEEDLGGGFDDEFDNDFQSDSGMLLSIVADLRFCRDQTFSFR
jgi:hypothetical protein